MLARSVQIFLALGLLWSCFTIQAQAMSPAPVVGERVEVQMTPELPLCGPSGSVDHAADERPGQAQAESGTDLPALVQQLAEAQIARAVVRPGPHRMAAWLTPTLDGLRRPPRGIVPSA